MNHQSLLLSSHTDMQRSRSSASSTPDMAHAYHATPSAHGWWNYGNSSFIRSQQESPIASNSTALLYRDSPVSSPYTQSPQIEGTFAALPYSPSFSPPETQTPLQPEFIFPGQNMSLASETKQWPGRVEPQIYEAPSLPTSPGWPMLSIEPFDTHSWNEMIMSALSPDSVPPFYTVPSPRALRTLLPCPSPSPSLSSSGSRSPAPSLRTSRRGSADSNGKTCSHCSATTTPLWRRDPATHLPLCNACGLYLQQRNKMRPAALIAADQHDDDDDADTDAGAAPGAPECSHCHTHKTSVWRRSKSGAKLCNACGVYARLRGRDRPLSLRRNKIRPRCKHPK
ncbi:hypothetical protein B0H19DRAFT_1080827 [Mycena capillaripes]|nr:hypothetical protein B0H19DRAFT_1080827 [Mycena capillaripes]